MGFSGALNADLSQLVFLSPSKLGGREPVLRGHRYSHGFFLQAGGKVFLLSPHSATKAGAPDTSEDQAFLLSLFHPRAWSCLEKGLRLGALVSHFVTLQNLNKSCRLGAGRELAQEWSWPQGREAEEIAGLWLSHLLILFLKPT